MLTSDSPERDKGPSFGVGVSVVVTRQGEILLGRRRNCDGAGTWGLPGGHLEFGESMVDAAARELAEETGLKAAHLKFLNVANDRGPGRHYVEVAFLAIETTGHVVLNEPDSHDEWRWFPRHAFPSKLFPPSRLHLALYLRGLEFGDAESFELSRLTTRDDESPPLSAG